MIIGIARVTIALPSAHSLKDKRHIVKSYVERARHRFNAAVAEIEDQDIWQSAVIGVVVISTNTAHADSMLASITNYLDSLSGEGVIEDISTETVSF